MFHGFFGTHKSACAADKYNGIFLNKLALEANMPTAGTAL
jgi:hypothetical protein